jgi:hypothetical protein
MGSNNAVPGEATRCRLKNADSFVAAATRIGDLAIYSVVSHPSGGRAVAPNIVLVHGLGLSQRYMMPWRKSWPATAMSMPPINPASAAAVIRSMFSTCQVLPTRWRVGCG